MGISLLVTPFNSRPPASVPLRLDVRRENGGVIPDAAPDVSAVAERYRRFARDDAPGRSDLYAEWAQGVAEDSAVQRILARIPATHRQPPLVFAVTRLLGAHEGPYAVWAEWLTVHADEVVAQASARSLQTNEPQRCAALLPALSLIEGPLALLEIGASAGLCLYPDRYGYRYTMGEGDVVELSPTGGSSVVLECAVSGSPPLRLPEVVWRTGIDLAPLDARDAEHRRFLTTLVWPGEQGRAERIGAALEIVAADPPLMMRGDAADAAVLDYAIDQAPPGATLVITTPGVMPHVPRAGREALIERLRAGRAEWITIDPADLYSWTPPLRPEFAGFVLGRNGSALATVDPLGAFVEWRAGSSAVGR
ncbi:DUF2332 domain-containing protein [Microbacterium lacus]|uniref:DUF2332 family protein n=1 Tax=Microbacterium lacus TaxID=415217 RepID=UPI00384D3C5A